MSLGNKTLQELTELKVVLLQRINQNPDHAGLDQVELKDVQDWIELRVREAERPKLEPTF
jgi:hypothetical protein